MNSTMSSFCLIYNNKKAILKLDEKGIDLVLWNINYTSSYTWLSSPIELQQVMFVCVRARMHICSAALDHHTQYQAVQ